MSSEHIRFIFSALVLMGSYALAEMWHLSRQLNLHPRPYILDKAHLI